MAGGAAVVALSLHPQRAVADELGGPSWAERQAVQLVRSFASDGEGQQDRAYRSLLELRLKAPVRYAQLRRAALKRSSGLRSLLSSVEQDESRANLMVTMLAQQAGARASVQRMLARIHRTDRRTYRRFKATVDTYLTSFMDTSYEAFGRTALCRALRAASKTRAAAPVAELYAEATAQIGALRGLFVGVENPGR